ncbi:MAG: hypothetical protein AB7D46_01195, partial [Flavobacteriaceae bacterium]
MRLLSLKKINFLALFLFSFLFLYKSNAQQIELYEQFFGKYDYVAIGNTLNMAENGSGNCTILTESTATLTLEADQTVIAAYLYWAGSGTGDFDVKLNGTDLTAERTFSTSMFYSNFNHLFFGAFVDVTDIVQITGNGDYTFSDIDLTTVIQQYCPTGLNFGGWSIVVIYEDPIFINNLVNVYDGFEMVGTANTNLNIQLQGINVIDPQGGKLGFLAWEGDEGIAINETLRINNNIISNPPLNPANNVFNGTNSFTGASDLYNMDLDFFDISAYVNQGDTTLDIQLTSNQDGVIVNNIVVVLSSELPDATITLNPDVQGNNSCGDRDLTVTFTVSNTEGTDVLPADIPIAFYTDGVLVGTAQTNQSLAIGESTTQTVNFTIPDTIPNNFELVAVVDDTGNGTGIQQEVSEDNNTFSLNVTLLDALEEAEVTNQENCSDSGITAVFDLTQSLVSVNPNYQVTFYTSLVNAEGKINAITNTSNYIGSGTIYVRVEDPVTSCFVIYDFELVVNQRPDLGSISDYNICIDDLSQTTIFDLTSKENDILQGQTATITFHTSQEDAEENVGVITNSSAYTNVSNPQVIYVRAQFTTNCYSTTSFELNVYQTPQIISADYLLCDEDGNGTEIFNLPSKANEIRNGEENVQISFHTSQNDALTGLSSINNITNYSSSGETIWVRALRNYCVAVTTLELVVADLPTVSQPIDYEACSDMSEVEFNLYSKNFEIGGGLPYSFTYYENLADFQNDNPIDNPFSYTNISNPQTIYVRIENQQGCYVTTQFDLVISQNPDAFTPDDYKVCDDNNDGYAVFNLTTLDDIVTGGITGINVTYHETYDDLVHNANIIQNPEQYFNIAPHNQTIYIAVTSQGGMCRTFTSVNLIVVPNPEITPVLPAYELCDDDYDGFVEFDLSGIEDAILNGLDPSIHDISYFHS